MKFFLRSAYVALCVVLCLAPSAFGLDNYANFAKSTLSVGISAGAATVTVASSSSFPTPPFNATIWNATDYREAGDDPSREIVRVTAINGNDLSITRAQESTAAAAHNTSGKVYRIVAPITAKLITDIAAAIGSGAAPTDATYITETPHASLSNEFALSTLGNGLLKNATGTGVPSIATAGVDYAAASHTHAESDVTNLVSDLAGKQATGNYLTALTGDVAASGPGSVAATLATVNANTGSWGSSTAIPTFTVNGKGLITAASTAAVVAPAGTLSGATLAAGVTASSLTSFGASPTLTTPTIGSFANATHSHQNAAGGGSLDAAAIGAGSLADARLSSNVPLKNGANDFTGVNTFPAGTGTQTYKASGPIFIGTTAAGCGVASLGNTAAVTEDTICTFSLPANTLSADSMALRYTITWSNAANADSKTVRAYFGSTSIVLNNAGSNNVKSAATIVVYRTGATTQYMQAVADTNGATSFSLQSATPAETLSNAVTIKVTAQAGAANANDIVLTGLMVEYLRP